MSKKILIGSGLVFISAIAYLMYFFLYANRHHSPEDTISYCDSGFEISVIQLFTADLIKSRCCNIRIKESLIHSPDSQFSFSVFSQQFHELQNI